MALKLARTLITKSAAIPSIFMIRSAVATNPSSRIPTRFRMFSSDCAYSSPFSDPNTSSSCTDRILKRRKKQGWVWKQAWEDACKQFEFEGDDSTISFKYWRVYINTSFLKGMSRDEIVDTYLNTFASVLGISKEEAKKKMYSVFAQDSYFFVCNVSEEVEDKLWEYPSVLAVEPLSNGDLKKAFETGEPFINGQVVPYDPNFYDDKLRDILYPDICPVRTGVIKPNPPGYSRSQQSIIKNIPVYSYITQASKMVKRMAFESFGAEKYYDSYVEQTTYMFRLNKYRPPKENETNLGLNGHTDSSFITVLSQSEVNGLEIQTKDGYKWITVTHSIGSFIVFAADGLMAWSNARLHSPLHRYNECGEDMVFYGKKISFCNGIIQTSEELVDEEHPLQFKPFSHAGFCQYIMDTVELKSKSPIRAYCGVFCE